jgi:hypothetical protein
MKYAERDKLVAGLRELADFIEQRGLELPIDANFLPSLTVYLYDTPDGTAREKMRKVARNIGHARKGTLPGFYDLQRDFGPVSLLFTAPRGAVCQRIVTGTKQIEEQVIPAHEEEIVEWICDDPILEEVAS